MKNHSLIGQNGWRLSAGDQRADWRIRRGQGGQLHIVLNWTEELTQILAKGGVQ